ncbi:MAG: hypothetical protein OXE87_06745 [Chloroflexi bacterium]|nr:hypothetical protein [Chloroflexota bacterium]
MNSQQQAQIASILEDEILRCAHEEFVRLNRCLPISDTATNVDRALRELQKLTRDEEPNYDEWTTLFYMLWYQPKHINLAYRILSAMSDARLAQQGRLTASGNLHVVDFGCGSLAMQFGLMLIVTDAISRGEDISQVRIDGFDTSGPMLRLGQDLWNKLLRRVKSAKHNDPWLQNMQQALDLTLALNGAVSPRVRIDEGDERWVSAIHAVYPSHVGTLRQTMQSLADTMQPTAAFMTTFSRKAHLMTQASPFENEMYQRHDVNLGAGLVGGLQQITQWRQNLVIGIDDRGGFQDQAVNAGFVRNYLKGLVNWNASDVAHLIYTRR